MNPSDVLIEVEGLRTEFTGYAGAVTAVDDVSFHVDRGETLAIVGESGSGKSATALSIIDLIPDPPGRIVDGEVRFEGRNLFDLDPGEMRGIRGRRIAMAFQDPMTSLNPVLTIGQQLIEGLQTHLGMDRVAARERAVDLLARVNIPNPERRIDDYPHQFSGGMRQRVMIAMALSCEPDVLIADEVTTALDVTIQAQILEVLKELTTQTDVALILITHDLGVVAQMAERVQVMYAGRVVERASVTELFENPRMPYTWGLLQSATRLDEERREKLIPIKGSPPDLASPPPGCRFAPRCSYSREICFNSEPPLEAIPGTDSAHESRCWGTSDAAEGGWLKNVRWKELRANPDGDGARASISEGGSVGVHVEVGGARRQSGESLVDVTDLRVDFTLARRVPWERKVVVRAVDGVDLTIALGETLGLVGESGCGKSSLGRAILQIRRPTTGSVRFDGIELTALSNREMRKMSRRMQMIFQDPYSSLNPRMTVKQIVTEPLGVHGELSTSEESARVMRVLDLVGLSASSMDRFPHEFSGGQRQRIGIARALVLEPDFIVADEPISALDVSIQAQIINLLQELGQSLGLTYLFIAHDLAVVRHISTRVAVMYLGKINEVADRNDLYREPLHPYTQALLSAAPVPDPKTAQTARRIVLAGDVASPVNAPSGCRFRTRCWKAQDVCAELEPELIEMQPGHLAACHFPG